MSGTGGGRRPHRFHPEWQWSIRQQRGKGCCLRSGGHSWGPPRQPASARATDGGRRKQGGQTPECLSDSPGETIQTVGLGAPGRLSRWSVRLQLRSYLEVCEFEPRVGLCADSSGTRACFEFCVSLSLCSSPAHGLSLSPSKINKKNFKKLKKKNYWVTF